MSAVSLWRCGGFLSESSAVAGTLSQSLCRDATAFRDVRPLSVPLAVAAAVPGATTLLYLVSGSL